MMFVDGFILKQGFGFLGIFSATSKQIFSIIFFSVTFSTSMKQKFIIVHKRCGMMISTVWQQFSLFMRKFKKYICFDSFEKRITSKMENSEF